MNQFHKLVNQKVEHQVLKKTENKSVFQFVIKGLTKIDYHATLTRFACSITVISTENGVYGMCIVIVDMQSRIEVLSSNFSQSRCVCFCTNSPGNI